jgi:hypothetical protein
MNDVVALARAHLATFAAHQGARPHDGRGAPWPLAIESGRLLGLAVRELHELRGRVRQLEAAVEHLVPGGASGAGRA